MAVEVFGTAAVAAVKVAVATIHKPAAPTTIEVIAIAPLATTLGAAVITRRPGCVTEIATEIATVTEIASGSDIAITIACEIAIVLLTACITSTACAFINHRTMATIAIAPTPMMRVTAMACSRARTMRAEDKIMIRSVRTSTNTALPASSLFSAVVAVINKPIAMAFCVVTMKATKTTSPISAAGAFTDSTRIADVTGANY